MTVVSGEVPTTLKAKAALRALLAAASNRLLYPAVGCAILLSVWWFGGYLIASNPDMAAFADFAPAHLCSPAHFN